MKSKVIEGLNDVLSSLGIVWKPQTPTIQIDDSASGQNIKILITGGYYSQLS